MYGIRMAWDEYKPCKPGTNEHDPSIGKWYAAGQAWLHEREVPILFECEVPAALTAQKVAEERRNAHPAFVLIAPARYAPTSSGEVMGCNGPDLSGLGGWLP